LSGGFSIERIFDCLGPELLKSVRLVVTRCPSMYAGPLDLVRNMLSLEISEDADVLHITGDVHYCTLSPVVRIPCIISVHDLRMLDWASPYKKMLTKLLWFTLPNWKTSTWTAVSNVTADSLLGIGIPSSKIEVIGNPVDSRIIFSDRPWSLERVSMLHVGTYAHKNLGLSILIASRMNARLTVVGPLTVKDSIELHAAGISFQSLPLVTDEEIAMLYGKHTILSFPSSYEGFGMPIVEAQAAGTVVLCADIPILRETAGDGAIFLSLQSPLDCLPELVRTLSSKLLWHDMIQKGRRNASRFAVSKVAAAYLELYRKVA